MLQEWHAQDAGGKEFQIFSSPKASRRLYLGRVCLSVFSVPMFLLLPSLGDIRETLGWPCSWALKSLFITW